MDKSGSYAPSVVVPFDCEQFPGKHEAMAVEEDGVILEMADDGAFFNRLLSREGGNGYSSRIWYTAAGVGRVPFDWEVEPGKPKMPPREQQLPPLSPPPFLQPTNHKSYTCPLHSKPNSIGLNLVHTIKNIPQRKSKAKFSASPKAKSIQVISCLDEEAENTSQSSETHTNRSTSKWVDSGSDSDNPDIVSECSDGSVCSINSSLEFESIFFSMDMSLNTKSFTKTLHGTHEYVHNCSNGNPKSSQGKEYRKTCLAMSCIPLKFKSF